MMLSKHQLFSILVACGVSAAFVSGCGGNNAGNKVKPKELKASSQLGGAGCASTGVATPLIVDLPDRASIESVMLDGVAFVKYDCNTIEILPDCRLAGEYTYRGLSRQEEFIALENQDELEANMMFTGGKGGAGLESGNALNIGLVTVGRTSTAALVSRSNMEGAQCAQATHYVKQAYVGAFAMKTMQKGKVSAAVDVFAVGGAAGSSSSNNSRDRKGGEIDACKSATKRSKEPTANCESLLRLMLSPVPEKLVSKKEMTKAKGEKKGGNAELEVCPKGMVFSGGKCATPKANTPVTCQPKQTDECLKQCNNGDTRSCYFYADLMYSNFCGDPSKEAECNAATADTKEAEALNAQREAGSLKYYKMACDGGHVQACYSLASNLAYADALSSQKEGMVVMQKACDMGYGEACYDLADAQASETHGFQGTVFSGLGNLERSCNLGYMIGCSSLGEMHFKGKFGKYKNAPNPAQGTAVLKQFCNQGDGNLCWELGSQILGVYDQNKIMTPPNPVDIPNAFDTAVDFLTKGCKVKEKYACLEAARAQFHAKKYDQAKLFLDAFMALDDDDSDVHILLGEMYANGWGVEKNMAKAVDYWEKVGEKPYINKAADALKSGKGVIRDKARAAKILAYSCLLYDNRNQCKEAERLDRDAYKKSFLDNLSDMGGDWAYPVAKKLDVARYKSIVAEACKRADNDPTDVDCKRLKEVQ